MSPGLAPLLDRVAKLHPQLCPRQVLGLRLGLYAGELLAVDVPRRDKRLLVFVETDGCFADGVSVATGCWVGRRTLRVVDYGKPAAVVADTRSGRAVRIWPHPTARARALEAVPDAPSRWHAYLAAYHTLRGDELFRWSHVAVTVSLDRLLGAAGARVVCARCREEVLNHREVLVDGRPLCRSCADGAYYAAVPSGSEGPCTSAPPTAQRRPSSNRVSQERHPSSTAVRRSSWATG